MGKIWLGILGGAVFWVGVFVAVQQKGLMGNGKKLCGVWGRRMINHHKTMT